MLLSYLGNTEPDIQERVLVHLWFEIVHHRNKMLRLAFISFNTADGSSVSMRVQGPLQTNSSEVLRASILADLGIGYVPDWLFNDALSSGDVVPLMKNWNTQTIPIHLISHAQRSRSMKVRAFGDHVARALAPCAP